MYKGDPTSKLFDCLEVKTCAKPKRVCFRTMVSFRKVLGRSSFRKIGRVLNFLTGTNSAGAFSVSCLKRPFPDQAKLSLQALPQRYVAAISFSAGIGQACEVIN